MSSEESESDHENEPESDEDESEEWEELATCGTGDEDVRLIVRRCYDDEQCRIVVAVRVDGEFESDSCVTMDSEQLRRRGG